MEGGRAVGVGVDVSECECGASWISIMVERKLTIFEGGWTKLLQRSRDVGCLRGELKYPDAII